MNRRQFNRVLGIGAAASIVMPTAKVLADLASPAALKSTFKDKDGSQVVSTTSKADLGARSSEHNVAMVVYPGFTALDLIGPNAVLAGLMEYKIHLVWKTRDIVTSDSQVPVQPTMTFAECPAELDILFIGGGTKGTFALMNDPEVLDFMARKAEKARYVTSVCTGSLVLGAAGLLRGYKATSHWAFRDILSEFGAPPTAEGVVEDRNRITGEGVTAGIDFGLVLASRVTTPQNAQAVQLSLEYDPQPPFKGGSPSKSDPAVLKMVNEIYVPVIAEGRNAAAKARERLAKADRVTGVMR